MRIIITRPIERARPLASRLQELDFEPLLAPMLKIERVAFDLPDAPLQGVVFTSVQGVEAVADQPALHIFPAFTVGTKTAGAARAAGFETVHNAEGDVEALFGLISETCNPGKGLILHLSGEQTAGKLVERLSGKDFEAKRIAVYEARPEDSFPSTMLENIRKKRFDAVVFFSARTAHIFNQVKEAAGVGGAFRHADAVCLSDNVAGEAEKTQWKKIHVSETPTEQGMIALLQALRK